MAKAVRWQIPFVSSIEKTQYRIDIYDGQDGTWSGVTTLTGGTSPIVTDEDASDDFFAPIRTQTGNIEVCTAIPGGGTLSLEDILPENNIDRPVRLMSIASDNSEKIEWQGFLSCQAYNQAYTDIPEIIQLPINSVLEAMDSVPVSMDRIGGIKSIINLVYLILKEIQIQCGLPCFTHINYSADDFDIFRQLIDPNVLFALKEYNHEYSTTYIVDGMSCKEALTRICTFMGWVAREMKTDVVLERLCSDFGMYREEIEDFYGSFHDSVAYNSPLATELSIFDPYWRGTNHQQSITQGAKSVEVVARLAKYEINLLLPEFPYGNTEEYYEQFNGPENRIYIVASQNQKPYPNVTLRAYGAELRVFGGTVENLTGEITVHDVLERLKNILDIYHVDSGTYGPAQVGSGAFFAKVAFETKYQEAHITTDGLFVAWLLRITSGLYNTQPIFQMSSPLNYSITKGYIKLNASMQHIVSEFDDHGEVTWMYVDNNWADKILMHIKFGNKYWNGSAWTTTRSLVWVDIQGSNFKKNWQPSMSAEETDGYLIPIDKTNGSIEIAIYPQINKTSSKNIFLADTFFSKLSVDYLDIDDDTLTDRSENRYFRLLGTNFRNEVSISTDLATTLNNTPSPSLILGNARAPIKEITYYKDNGTGIDGATTEKRRPEIDLLNRLARYYQKARRKLNLIVKYARTIPPKDRLVLRNDNKEYRPMAESCDWKNDTSDITFMEIPNE